MTFLKYNKFINESSITNLIDKLGDDEKLEIEDMDNYINILIDNGAKRFSGGSSAEVLTDSKGVLKVFAPINDPGMARYLQFCLDNKKNVYVPKIFDIKKSYAIDESRWIYSVSMEKLKPCSKDFTDELNKYLFSKSYENPNKGNKVNNDIFFNEIKNIISKYGNYNEKSLNEILKFLEYNLVKYKYEMDFGPQNWMMRGNQLVLIDPFWPTME